MTTAEFTVAITVTVAALIAVSIPLLRGLNRRVEQRIAREVDAALQYPLTWEPMPGYDPDDYPYRADDDDLLQMARTAGVERARDDGSVAAWEACAFGVVAGVVAAVILILLAAIGVLP